MDEDGAFLFRRVVGSRDLLQVDHELCGVAFRVGQELGAEEGKDVV